AQKFMEHHNIHLITIQKDLYPEQLRNIYDPPIGLFTKGNQDLLKRDIHIGIVGSRKASPTGKRQARKFSSELSEMGMTIVSGLAEGIDSESHRGSLGKIGSTIAVMGTGINVCYPTMNRALYKEIVKEGLIVTEFFMDEQPLKFHFPLRNRIISGLSDGILIVEARDKSGALITANYALEQGKNVYAIPGDITLFQSMGSNQLIKDGAKVVTEPKDILEDYIERLPNNHAEFHNTFSLNRVIEAQDTEEERVLLKYIAEGYNTIDLLLPISGKSIQELNAALSMMEINDSLKIEFGKIY
ncbi:MAG: DNA-processing protein DprA, partial [Eubacterium sp.]